MSHLGIRAEGLGIRADLFFEEIKSKLSYDFKDCMPGKTSNLKNHLGQFYSDLLVQCPTPFLGK